MGKTTVSAEPTAPDPVDTASAQTGSNINTAIANTLLGNANTSDPYGTTTTTISGYTPITDPSTGQTYQIPQFSKNTTLSDAEQSQLDQENQLTSALNNVAIDQTSKIGGLLGTNVNTNGFTDWNTASGAGQGIVSNVAGGGKIQKSVGANDFSADRTKVEEALMSRIAPQIEMDRNQLENKLINQGFVRGTEGFNQAMDELNRSATDQRFQAVLAGGQEQSRMFGMDLDKGNFANAAQAQQYGQNLSSADFANAAQNQGFNQGIAQTQSNNTTRQAQLQEALSLRNQPINEISALMSSGQITLPQYQAYTSGQVQSTPIGDYYQQNYQNQNANYQTQVKANASETAGLYSALGSIAGTGLYGLTSRK